MTYSTAVLADNPVHYWELQDAAGSTTAADGAATGAEPLTVNGGTLGVSGLSSGDPALAWQASGTSTGYLSIASDASLNITGDLTLEILVYPINRSNYWWLIDKSQNGASGQPLPFEWRLENSTGKQYFVHNGGTTLYSNTAPPLNQWNHLAVTRTGTTITYFLNGVADGSGNIGGAPNASTNDLVVATRSGDRYSYAPSGMKYAAAALYSAALSAARIQAHYAQLAGGNTRLTQAVLEVLDVPVPTTRLTQEVVEIVVLANPGVRLTQAVVEILEPLVVAHPTAQAVIIG